jgi:hypothetical protein
MHDKLGEQSLALAGGLVGQQSGQLPALGTQGSAAVCHEQAHTARDVQAHPGLQGNGPRVILACASHMGHALFFLEVLNATVQEDSLIEQHGTLSHIADNSLTRGG